MIVAYFFMRRHESILCFSIHINWSLHAVQNHIDQSWFIARYVLLSCNRREAVVIALTITLMTACTIVIEQYTSFKPVACVKIVCFFIRGFDVCSAILSFFHFSKFRFAEFILVTLIHHAPDLSFI